MNASALSLLTSLCIGAAALPAAADPVRITVTGVVEWNSFSIGALVDVAEGDLVTMRFEVDSSLFQNSPNFPTRAYPIDQATFSLKLGSTHAQLLSPMPPEAVPAFVVRDNDPGIDGFMLSTGLDFPDRIPLAIGVEDMGLAFQRTFDSGETLPSLDILDALGSWETNDISSYNWTIGRGDFIDILGIDYRTITIALLCRADFDDNAVVEPVDIAAFVNAWSTSLQSGTLAGDFDRSGVVEPVDIAVFIAAWFNAVTNGC